MDDVGSERDAAVLGLAVQVEGPKEGDGEAEMKRSQ